MPDNEKRQEYTVGVIHVENSLSTVIEQEFRIGLPDNVRLVMERAPMDEVSYRGLMQFLDAVPEAASRLACQDPDIIVVPSMTGSCIKGYEIINILEQHSGLPVVVPAIELKNSLRELGLHNIAIVSALGVELGLLEQLFFHNHGIEVIKTVNIFDNSSRSRELIDTLDNSLILEGVRNADFSGVEAVVFDSPTYSLRPIIDELEKYIKVPMLSVNQVLIRGVLKRLGLPEDHLPVSKYFEKVPERIMQGDPHGFI